MMDEYSIIVPEEDRVIVLVEEDFVLEIPGEWRWIEVPSNGPAGE